VPSSKLVRLQATYQAVAAVLRQSFGTPLWVPCCPPVDELVNCILSQSTTDTNRDRAFALLKGAFPTWEAVRDAPLSAVVEAIRPAGLANQKAPRIQNALRYITAQRGSITLDFLGDMPVSEAKAWLMDIDGVGPKTAAIVLCFAFGKPAFPVDTHIHRVAGRIGLLPAKMSAEKAHDLMESIIPPEDYYPGHLNLIRLGREICTARRAYCERCPLTAWCDYYQHSQKSSQTKSKGTSS